MKIKSLLTLLFALMLNFASSAQNTIPNTNDGQKNNDAKSVKKYTAKDYENLVSKLKTGDTNIDYTTLRMSFAETKEYSFHGPDKSEKEKFFKPFSEKKYKDALKESEKFLEENYVEANAHFIAYNSAKELKDDKKAEFHKAVLLGLLNSIQSGNNGLSEKTPFYVITIDEEYTLLRFLGYQFGGTQSLRHIDDHTFDVLTAIDPKTNQKSEFYFNIDVVWAAETKIFGGN